MIFKEGTRCLYPVVCHLFDWMIAYNLFYYFGYSRHTTIWCSQISSALAQRSEVLNINLTCVISKKNTVLTIINNSDNILNILWSMLPDPLMYVVWSITTLQKVLMLLEIRFFSIQWTLYNLKMSVLYNGDEHQDITFNLILNPCKIKV